MPAWLLTKHFSRWTGYIPACWRLSPLLSLNPQSFLGGVLLDKMRPEQAPLLFIIGLLTAGSVLALMLSQQPAMLARCLCWRRTFSGDYRAAIPMMVQHHAPREAAGRAAPMGSLTALAMLRGVYSAADGSGDEIGGISRPGFPFWWPRRRLITLLRRRCCCACVAQQQ